MSTRSSAASLLRRCTRGSAIGPRDRSFLERAVLGGLAVLASLVACGGAAATPDEPLRNQPAATPDARTPIEKRRDAACEQLGPKLTACAVEDARADLAAGKITKSQFDADTAPAIQRKNTQDWLDTCKGAFHSSRKVRVLEVCFREETRCEPLLDCLAHLNDPNSP